MFCVEGKLLPVLPGVPAAPPVPARPRTLSFSCFTPPPLDTSGCSLGAGAGAGGGAGAGAGSTLLIRSCAKVTWYRSALSLLNFFSQSATAQLTRAAGRAASLASVLSVSASMLSLLRLAAVSPPSPATFRRFFFFLFFFFLLRNLLLWSGASVSADLRTRSYNNLCSSHIWRHTAQT